MEDEELEEFSSLSDEAGEISKHDLIVQTKKSSFWKGNLDLKSKPSGHSTKVILVVHSSVVASLTLYNNLLKSHITFNTFISKDK